MTQSNFLDAYQGWYAVANKYADFGACDTEPRGEFASIIAYLAVGTEPKIPTTADGWQLYTGEGQKGVGLAAAALTRAARKAVEAGKADHMGLMKIAKANGWAW